MKLVEMLVREKNYEVAIHDPHVDDAIFKYGELKKPTALEAADGADLFVLAVNHSEYLRLDFEEIGKVMRTRQIYDTRNFLGGAGLEALGFKVLLLGRG
jgi:UDP-N-acetyl-D-mannosaminuronate dehydrogenase